MRYRSLSTSCEPSRTAFPRWRKQRSSSLNALHTPTRKAPALRATGAFFMRSGKLYFLSSSTGTVPTSRPSSSTTAPSVPRRLVLHARSAVQWFARWKSPPRHHCNRDREIDKPVAILYVEKIPRHIQDRLLFIAKGAAPALCCGAGVGPRRPRNPGVVVAQPPKLRSSNSSDAPGIGQQRERDGMRSQRPQGAFRRR
jgi:hypothetical protein